VALAIAVLIAVVAIGLVGGFSLMFPTIAYEDSDCFDSMSRSFSYIYNKPWRMGLYMTIAFVYGAICYMFVRFFSFLVLWTTHTFLQLGFAYKNTKLHAIWPEPALDDFFGAGVATTTNWSTSISSALIYFWVLVVVGLVVAFVISFYFSASTIIYALMRNRVDLIALEDVYVYSPPETAEASPSHTAAEKAPSETEPPTEHSGEKQETSR
jgi:flagellar basal body-associated protein FliL